MKQKNIVVFGSTGSIGKMTLEVLENFLDEYKILALSANTNLELLKTQIKKFFPKYVIICDKKKCELFLKNDKDFIKKYKLEVLCGEEGLVKVLDISDDKIDFAMICVVGAIGLKSIYKCLQKGIKIALANKEPIVIAGEFLMKEAKKHNNFIFPVDSEHSAIFQCLLGENKDTIRRLIITASGGPFYKYNLNELEYVSVTDALSHPRWKMGEKITIDSATLMNKGFEVIEAHYLFDIPQEKIEVIIHPESIVHSMVEFNDGSIKAQLCEPDMKIPIQYSMTYPNRKNKILNENTSFCEKNFIDFQKLKQINFEAIDYNNPKYICLKLAVESLKKGSDYLTVLNSANEVLVEMFLRNKIKFLDISKSLIKILKKHKPIKLKSVDEVIELDKKTKKDIYSFI
ncbi:MAG: 1-deoxy-D-xylulose-5-phosphate reductoisomerase [Elusimicrobiota bacterium]|nr:1-deoxy-D-xylulose-5-phosphate reductoisomerase [Elusimicrobiota bacterium]